MHDIRIGSVSPNQLRSWVTFLGIVLNEISIQNLPEISGNHSWNRRVETPFPLMRSLIHGLQNLPSRNHSDVSARSSESFGPKSARIVYELHQSLDTQGFAESEIDSSVTKKIAYC